MISYSGFKHEVDGPDPPLRDAAVALSRLPRWCGSTRYEWSVLQHSLVVSSLLKPLGVDHAMAGLLHDIEEGLGWGDIARPLKPVVVADRQFQHRYGASCFYLDLPFGHTLRTGTWAGLLQSEQLHEADRLSADAERFLMIDGDYNRDRSIWNAVNLCTRNGYGIRLIGDRQVETFTRRFEELKSGLHALWNFTPGTMLGTVAGSPVGGVERSLGCTTADSWTSAARGDLGGVGGDEISGDAANGNVSGDYCFGSNGAEAPFDEPITR